MHPTIYSANKLVIVSDFIVLGYLQSSHGNSQIPLQQQLEHANQKSGFTDDKFKMQQVGQVRHINKY